MSNRGGKRPGAGRPKGAKNKETLLRDEHGDLSPLEYMQFLLNKNGMFTKAQRFKFEVAKAMAPFYHPKLSSQEVQQKVTGEITQTVINAQPELSAEEWQRKHAPSGDRSQDHKPH